MVSSGYCWKSKYYDNIFFSDAIFLWDPPTTFFFYFCSFFFWKLQHLFCNLCTLHRVQVCTSTSRAMCTFDCGAHSNAWLSWGYGMERSDCGLGLGWNNSPIKSSIHLYLWSSKFNGFIGYIILNSVAVRWVSSLEELAIHIGGWGWWWMWWGWMVHLRARRDSIKGDLHLPYGANIVHFIVVAHIFKLFSHFASANNLFFCWGFPLVSLEESKIRYTFNIILEVPMWMTNLILLDKITLISLATQAIY